MSDVREELIASLSRRVQELEDERAVRDAIVRYGLAVNRDDADGTAALYADDCEIDIDDAVFLRGRDGARTLVTSDAHEAILPNCAHLMGPLVIEVDGDHAVATGYQTVYVTEQSVGIWRQSFGRWELEKRAGRWQITRRVSRHVGHPGAGALFDSM